MNIPFKHKFTRRYDESGGESTITGYCYEPTLCTGYSCPIFFRTDYYDGSVQTEYEVLSQLQEYDFVPKIIAISNIESHKVLFTGCIDGVSLDYMEIDDPKWKDGIIGALNILHKLYIEKGFLHGDMAVNNIMIDKDDKVYIIDFEGSVLDKDATWIDDLMRFVDGISYSMDDAVTSKLESLYGELDALLVTKSTNADLYMEYITKFKNILFS